MFIKLALLLLYFAILFGIGIWSSGKIRDIKDYYVGGKKLGYWVAALSTRATGESAWLLLGLTGLGAVVGVSAFWVVVGEIIGVSVAWFLMAGKFKKLTDQYESITVPDYLVSRFRSSNHSLRIISAIVLSVFVIIYISAQIDATGSAFEAFMGWNYFTGAILGFVVVVIYILFGGFIAVAWSDVFQGILMFIGLVLLPIVGFLSLDNFSQLGQGLYQIDPDLLNPFGPGGLTGLNIATLIGYVLIGLGFMGSPQLFVRFMSVKDQSEIKKGRWVALFYTLITDSAAVMVGLFARYFFTESGVDTESMLGNNGQNSVILLAEHLLPVFFTGLFMAVVLAAIMSTIDSLLVVASSAVVRDIYQQILHPNLKIDQLTRMSRIVTFGMALIALLLAMTVALTTPERTIFWFVIFGWSGIAASFCPVIILSLFWKGFTEKGAIAAMVAGFLSVPICKFILPQIASLGIYIDKIDVIGPSFLIAFVMGYVVSKAYPDKGLSENFIADLKQ